MKIKAHAKINLVLSITGRRPDGYHNVDMIMQSIGLCDIINVEKRLCGIELSGTGSLSYDESNLAYKAARLFFDVTGIRRGVSIHIQKNIPMCAGMAGGSSDAAAVLRALNTMFGRPLTRKALTKVSASLGADVPYCIMGGTARAQGIGDILTPIAPLGRKTLVVVKPPIAVSTPKAYASVNLETIDRPDTGAASEALARGDSEALFSLMGNSFEKSIFAMFPEIGEIKKDMLSYGARVSLMSGSGSAVFGIFESDSDASSAYESFKPRYKETFITYTV